MRKSWLILIMLPAFLEPVAADRIPEKFQGEWTILLIEYDNYKDYPWWREVKYPIELTLGPNGGRMVDQTEFACELRTFAYDPDLDSFNFLHCGIGPKHPDAFGILQVAHVERDGQLRGEVRSYKTLFHWVGEKVPDADLNARERYRKRRSSLNQFSRLTGITWGVDGCHLWEGKKSGYLLESPVLEDLSEDVQNKVLSARSIDPWLFFLLDEDLRGSYIHTFGYLAEVEGRLSLIPSVEYSEPLNPGYASVIPKEPDPLTGYEPKVDDYVQLYAKVYDSSERAYRSYPPELFEEIILIDEQNEPYKSPFTDRRIGCIDIASQGSPE